MEDPIAHQHHPDVHIDDMAGLDDTSASASTSESSSYNAEKKLSLLDTISRVQRQYMQSEGPKVVFGCLLEALLELMDSEYGFIGEVKYEEDGTMFLQTHAITNIAWDTVTKTFYEENVDSGLRFYNMESLFGTVMTTGKHVISNDPANDKRGCGVPQGHPPLNHFLGIPFFQKGGEINGMVGIANKPGGYNQGDIEFLEPFTVTCGNLIQAYCQVQLNKELIESLEQKVKERTRELELVNESLEEANRRVVQASAAQLKHFACMSHEIRTPLNCIIGLSSLLQETKLTPMQEETVRMIVTSGDLLLTVVNDVLDYSKLESGNVDIEIRKSNLQETLNSIVHSIEMKSVSKGLQVRTFYDPALPEYVQTDSRRMQQILYNLLGNAVKFSPEGGVIEVTAELATASDRSRSSCSGRRDSNRSDRSEGSDVAAGTYDRRNSNKSDGSDSAPVTVVAANPAPPSSRCPFKRSVSSPIAPRRRLATEVRGGLRRQGSVSAESDTECRLLRLIVKDYGKGINEKDFDRIFKPFLQATADTERLYGGTGLGLAITAKLAKALGGTITVESEEGKYSTFTVELPFLDQPVDMPSVTKKLEKSTVLVVGKQRDVAVHQFSSILDSYSIDSHYCKTMGDAELFVRRQQQQQQVSSRPSSDDRSYVCVVHEDLFDDQSFDLISRISKRSSVLMTFGPKYSVKKAAEHTRSLTRVLPSVLMSTMIGLVEKLMSVPGTARDRLSAAEAARQAQARRDALTYTSLRILIAEDNVINQKVLSRMLSRLGIKQFDIADNGRIAVDREAKKKYDILLMDMQMPVMDGLEATRKILKRDTSTSHAHPSIVFVTAYVSEGFESECIAAGAAGFLAKPFNISDIQECLKRTVESRRCQEEDASDQAP